MPATLRPTERFSTRVENYVKYRPGYPPVVLDLLRAECGLTPAAVVADIGSGTGLLTRLFLEHGNHVYGVEPNREMREAGERLLAAYPNFASVDGAAEATTLPDACADLVTAAQAFHWFDRVKARVEFARIGPGGWAALIWNERRWTTSPLAEAYERLIAAYGSDYAAVNYDNVGPADLAAFFGGEYRQARFDNQQRFDFAGLRGRLLSASYAPEPGHPSYEPMLADLRSIFDAHQVGGTVVFEYDTRVYYGHIR
ncbi:MAG: class I SAM-dependent methyltransferase [Chloroflexi bacterium]|nr:class I SAM-dependent methyltransferase [Chloroflexota bacterium]